MEHIVENWPNCVAYHNVWSDMFMYVDVKHEIFIFLMWQKQCP